MTHDNIDILVVDDDISHCTILQALLRGWGYNVALANSGRQALEQVREQVFDLVLCDVRMAEMDGIATLKEIKALNPAIPVLIMTAYSSVETAVEALKTGALDYPATYERFTSIGPLMEKIGNGGKGIAWNTQSEMDLLRKLNYTKAEGPAKGQPMLNTAIDAAEMILTLAPETNGQVAVKAWAALSEFTGRDHTHLALNREDEKIRFRDIQAQPRKIISSPTWSGLEDEHVSYNAELFRQF